MLGAGVEGVVLAGGDLVTKVWFHKSAAELEQLRSFYDALASTDFPLGFPRILDVRPLEDAWVTTQPRLDGLPLWADQGVSPPLEPAEVEAVLTVLAALAATPGTPGLAGLPVLPGAAPFDAATPFEHHLADLVESRVSAHPDRLAVAVTHLEELVSATTARLRQGPVSAPALLHGDLIPANILVGPHGAAAVLDFGFFTTVGDPAFEAAVATSVHDMYGPHAAATEARLEAAVLDRFGYDPERLNVYRAAYALTTAHCFSASGSDGHFAWCARMLDRPGIAALR